MHNISSFLERFKKLRDPKQEREEIAKLISKCIDAEVLPASIEIKGDCLQIKMRGGMKTLVFIKKEEIAKALKENFPKLHITKIC